jgi:hypothetical protein
MARRVAGVEWKPDWARLKALARQAKGVRVGWFSGKRHGGGEISLARLAAVHEFGAPQAGIPARAPLGTAVREQEQELVAHAVLVMSRVVAGTLTMQRGLEVLGKGLAQRVRRRMLRGRHLQPRLKAATVAAKRRRGSSSPTRPLVDTGELADSVEFRVVRL